MHSKKPILTKNTWNTKVVKPWDMKVANMPHRMVVAVVVADPAKAVSHAKAARPVKAVSPANPENAVAENHRKRAAAVAAANLKD